MALADPLSLTIGSDTHSLARTGSGEGSGTFATNDGNVTFRVSHSVAKRNRTLVRIDVYNIVPDVLVPDVNVPASMSVQLVIDRPKYGFDQDTQKALTLAIGSALAASSGALTTKILGGES